MKSIFNHFSIPGPKTGILCNINPELITELHAGIFYLKGLSFLIKQLINPFLFIKVFGFPLIFLFIILGLIFLKKTNIIRQTYPIFILKEIENHFKEVHNNFNSIKIKNGKSKINNYGIYNLLFYLFLSLALINLGGMINGTWCITTWFSATIGLTLTIWLATLGIRLYNYFILFMRNINLNSGEELIALAGFFPGGTPLWLAPLMVIIEILSWIIRFLSMGLRIAGNIVAGHVILGILGFAYQEINKLNVFEVNFSNSFIFFMSQLAYITLVYFELAVAIIQAYVLTLLASTFLKETEELH